MEIEIGLSELQQRIKIVENEIKMLLNNLNDENVAVIAKKELSVDLGEKYDLLNRMKNLRDNKLKEETKVNKTYETYNFVNRAYFLINGLEKFGIAEYDIVGYNDHTLTNTLTIISKNNIIHCPIVTVRNYIKNKGLGYEKLLEEIRIETLDKSGRTLYETIYKGLTLKSVGTISGDYKSREPQEFELTITYDDFDIDKIDRAIH